MQRSFPDAGVLIEAARGVTSDGEIALAYFNQSDQTRLFLTSPFVRMEVLPKAEYFRRVTELAFYRDFFQSPSVEWCRDFSQLIALADTEARQHGLGALDALHIAAAALLGADELVTTERSSKPIYRTRLVQVRYLYAEEGERTGPV